MLAIGAGGRAGSIVPPPGARGQPWRYKQRGRAQGRHLILGGTPSNCFHSSTEIPFVYMIFQSARQILLGIWPFHSDKPLVRPLAKFTSFFVGFWC